MALTAPQATQMTVLDNQIADLKKTLMDSPQCTMGGMGNYIFDAFKKMEAQAAKVRAT